jgi:hypothetical protein
MAENYFKKVTKKTDESSPYPYYYTKSLLEDMQIQPNKVVSLTYELRVDDENGEQTLVEKVERDHPLVFLYGAGSMLEEFERHLNGTQGRRCL